MKKINGVKYSQGRNQKGHYMLLDSQGNTKPSLVKGEFSEDDVALGLKKISLSYNNLPIDKKWLDYINSKLIDEDKAPKEVWNKNKILERAKELGEDFMNAYESYKNIN